MDIATQSAVSFTSEDLGIVAELLTSERAKLLVEIRHTDHRSFREEVRHRLDQVDRLLERLQEA